MAVPGAPDSAPSNGSQPGGPSDSSQPAGPADGSQPGGPSDGSQPAGPADGSQPGGPSDGSQPAGPADGSQPGGHSDSSQPAGPADESPPGGPPAGGVLPDDPLPEAVELARAAARAGLGLKLLGGLAVRVLCPEFPPRLRRDQDIDFACLSKERKKVASHLAEVGCEPDRRFNNLNGDRQMYFTAPSGRPIDVMVDRLTMCHTLDFRPSFSRLPLTVDAIDVLLSKLQIIELNEKDVRDVVHLLAALPLGGSEGVALDVDRFCRLLGADWGWWRTVTGNLAKLPGLIAERPDLVPPNPAADPVSQAQRLAELAGETPKSMKWRLRANVGDRVRWYQLPEEVAH